MRGWAGRRSRAPPGNKGGGQAAHGWGAWRRRAGKRAGRRGAMLCRWARRAAWPCNVVAYAALFAAGDAAQQELVRRRRRRGSGGPDWRQTRHVALVALTFHGHFSYAWLRALERLLPGRAPRAVLAKVLCDQLLAAPLALLAFYTGESLGGREGCQAASSGPRRAPAMAAHLQATGIPFCPGAKAKGGFGGGAPWLCFPLSLCPHQAPSPDHQDFPDLELATLHGIHWCRRDLAKPIKSQFFFLQG